MEAKISLTVTRYNRGGRRGGLRPLPPTKYDSTPNFARRSKELCTVSDESRNERVMRRRYSRRSKRINNVNRSS